MSQRGLLLILSSPSGAGKSTLAKRLISKNDRAQFSVSATTRAPRPGEVEGADYYFRTHAQFDQMIANGEMLEYATVFENSYGSPRGPVVDAMEDGRDVIFDVDWQGGQQIRVSDLAETVERRMSQARSEISHWPEYDYVLINEDLDRCEAELDLIIAAERLRRVRQLGLVDKVRSLNEEFETR